MARLIPRSHDVDVAQEVANLSKYANMKQAAVAVLKQANLQPQLLLALLQ
jgi:flagellin-like hook-associated protein FlgL